VLGRAYSTQDVAQEDHPCPLLLPGHWHAETGPLSAAAFSGDLVALRLAVAQSEKEMRATAAAYRGRRRDKQHLQDEMMVCKNALLMDKKILDHEKARRKRAEAHVAFLKTQLRQLALLATSPYAEEIARKQSQVEEMENKYERAVDKSLTYHFIADRLDGYILEERLLLRELEEKVATLAAHKDEAALQGALLKAAKNAEEKLMTTKQSLLGIEQGVRTAYIVQQQSKHRDAKQSRSDFEASHAKQKAASSEWCREQKNELKRRADNAKSELLSTLELKGEYEQALQRLAAVTGPKSSEARFFECQAQKIALRKTATDLEEHLAARTEEHAALTSVAETLTLEDIGVVGGDGQAAGGILRRNATACEDASKQSVAVEMAVREATGSRSPMSIATLHRIAQTRKKDNNSLRRSLLLPSDQEFDTWAAEMGCGGCGDVEAADDELVETRFRDMMEVKRNHLSAAILANQDTQRRLKGKEHLLTQLRLALALFVDQAKVLHTDQGVRAALKQLRFHEEAKEPTSADAPDSAPLPVQRILKVLPRDSPSPTVACDALLSTEGSSGSDDDGNSVSEVGLQMSLTAGGDMEGGGLPLEVQRLLKQMHDSKNLLLTALQMMRAASPVGSPSSSSSTANISRASSGTCSKRTASSPAQDDAPQIVDGAKGAIRGANAAFGGGGGHGHEVHNMFAAAAMFVGAKAQEKNDLAPSMPPPKRSFADVWSGSSYVEQTCRKGDSEWRTQPAARLGQMRERHMNKFTFSPVVDLSRARLNQRISDESMDADLSKYVLRTETLDAEKDSDEENDALWVELKDSDDDENTRGKGSGLVEQVLSREDVKGMSARDIRLREREQQRAERQRQALIAQTSRFDS